MFKKIWFVARVSAFMLSKVFHGFVPYEWYGGVEERDGKNLAYLNISFSAKKAPVSNDTDDRDSLIKIQAS